MIIEINDVNYKGRHFDSVTVDIPTINSLDDDHSLIKYFVCKELDRIIRG